MLDQKQLIELNAWRGKNMIIDLIRNATLLITLIVLYGILSRGKNTDTSISQTISGFLFGGIAIIGMHIPINYSPGIFYDGRTIVLSLAGLFSGGITSVLSVLLAGIYRIYLGGTGIWAGTASIITAGLIGMLFRRFYQNKPETVNVSGLIMMGLSVHLTMLICQLLLPWPSGLTIIPRIWIPVLLIFPFATIITGVFLRNGLRRVIAEASIRKSEVLYRTTLHSIGDAVLTTGHNGKINFMNPIAEQLTGWTEQDALGLPVESVFHIIHEDTGHLVENPLRIALKKGRSTSLANHTLLISKSGQKIPIADSGAPIRDENEAITGAVLVFRDQTDERRKQQQIRASEKNFRQSMDESPLGMRIVTESGNTLYMNKALLDIYGFKNIREFKDTPAERRYTEACLHLHQQRKERRKKGENVESEYDIELVRKDGGIRNVHIYRKMLNWDGKPRYLAIYQDYTDRKKAEDALIRSEYLLKESQEIARIGSWEYDLVRGFTEWSENCYRLYGLEHGRITPTFDYFMSRIHQDDFQIVDRGYRKILAEGEPTSIQFRIVFPGNQIKWILNRIIPVFKDGKLVKLRGIVMDITDSVKSISALEKAKNKAEESDRLKSAFLANMSHEIRTPLNTILGFSSILAAEEEISLEEKEEYSSIINRSSDNLLQIINDILDISKLETGQLKIFNTRFNALAVLDELNRVFEKRLSELGKTGIQLRLSTHNEPVRLNLDRVRFYQIFTNLLNNSVKFTEKGEIAFGISGVTENNAFFFVSDTGIGIQKELHSAVFERFRQVNETNTRAHGGTGLGLSIVKNLIELMGGTIMVESEPDHGTTFRFTLPVENNRQDPLQPSVN